MYSTTASSEASTNNRRSFRRGSFNLKHNRSRSSSKSRLSTRSSSSNRSNSTPLAALANKFDKFKKRMKNTSKKERVPRSYDEKKNVSYTNIDKGNEKATNAMLSSYKMAQKYPKYNPQSTEMNAPAVKGNSSSDPNATIDVDLESGAKMTAFSSSNSNIVSNSHSNSNNKNNGDNVNKHGSSNQTDVAYSQVMDGMMKMSSASRDDLTTATASSTQPSYSHDDGSTIVSDDAAYTYHTFPAGKEQFTVDKRYSMIRTIGSGAYGVVVSAKDRNQGSNVAIKMIPRAFHDEIDAKRILREIKLLKHFKHENIITIFDMMPPLARNVEDFNDVYIVTELMETDLHRIIYSKQSLSIDHVQYFLYQALRALKYMHSANVLHRDLKPSNLLVNSNCDLKVCDFGLARGISSTHDDEHEAGNGGSMLLTEYVVTRWYRAPEIMLACHEYSKPSDVWSVGCIFAELLGRKPFFPGDDYIDQLTIITEKLGKLPEEDLDFVTTEKAKRFMRKLNCNKPTPLSKRFPNANAEGLDLLNKMLQIHPRKRIDVVGALEHPFFSSLHNPNDEPTAHAHFDFSFEDEKLNRVRLQELIWKEISDFRPSCLPIPPRNDGSKTFCRNFFHS